MESHIESKKDQSVQKLQSIVEDVNVYLRQLESKLEQEGITMRNRKEIEQILLKFRESGEKIHLLIAKLSPEKVTSIRVTWIDGTILFFPAWNSAVVFAMGAIEEGLAKKIREASQQ